MLKSLLLLVAAVTGLTVLMLSFGVSTKDAAEAGWNTKIAALSPQVTRLAVEVGSCLAGSRTNCVPATMTAPSAGIQRGASPGWKNLNSYLGAASGCASQFNSFASAQWLNVAAADCPADAYTVFLVMALDPSSKTIATRPFTEPRGWWFPPGTTAAATTLDDRFSGVAVLTVPDGSAAPMYVWARTYQP